MASLDFDALAEPIDPDDPCGPDLELEDDPIFMQFTARAEQLMPAAFMQRDENDGRLVMFDRSSIDFKAEFATAAALLDRTRDLRLLAICCRFSALNRDLAGCARGVAAIAALLRTHWDAVHPRGVDGDFSYRMAMLQVLDDVPSVIQPIQHLPLFTHRRFGPISYRTVLVTRGRANARPDETVLGPSELERAFGEADPAELAAAAEAAALLHAEAGAIAAETMSRVGALEAIRLRQLVELAGGLLDFLGAKAASELPKSAPDTGSDAGPAAGAGTAPVAGPAGPVSDQRAAAAALAAVSAYFAAHERSSPVALLVRQAERLIGLPFHEVIRTLLPRYADEATIYIGPTPAKSFQLRVDRITETLGDQAELHSSPDHDATVTPEMPAFNVENRAGAVALLREIGSFYRSAEPASPIPLFTDRACAMVNQDFLSILTDVLPGVRLHRDDD